MALNKFEASVPHIRELYNIKLVVKEHTREIIEHSFKHACSPTAQSCACVLRSKFHVFSSLTPREVSFGLQFSKHFILYFSMIAWGISYSWGIFHNSLSCQTTGTVSLSLSVVSLRWNIMFNGSLELSSLSFNIHKTCATLSLLFIKQPDPVAV